MVRRIGRSKNGKERFIVKTLIIYHQRKGGHDCPDGLGAAWAATRKYPDSQAIGWTYEAECLPPIPDECDRIVVVDFSFPAKVLEQWRESVSEVIVIDHHKTAMDMLDGLSARVLKYFDMDECGATLAWKTFFPDEPVPVFLQYFRDRDLWCHELSFTREVHEAISNMRHKLRQQHYTYLPEIFALFDGLSKLSRDELTVMAIAVAGDKIAELMEIERLIAQSWLYGVVGSYGVPVVYLKADGAEDRHVSWAMHHLCTELRPEALFVACYTSSGTCELRSNKNNPAGGFDVGELAREMGGGGHRNAD